MILALLLTLSAPATQLEQGSVACPIGGAPTNVHRLLARNQAGWDSDGARYANSGQWRAYAIATCPDNLLSLYGVDMTRTLREDELAALQPVVDAQVAAVADPDALKIWDRYELAADAYTALGKDDWFLGNLLLKGSWTARDAVVGEPFGMRGPAHARLLLTAGDQELAKELPAANRKSLLFNLAKIAHRAGLSAERDTYLTEVTGLTPHTEAESEALTAFGEVPKAEARLQDAAIGHLEKTEAGGGARAEEASYLLADLLRRRGRADEALPRFEKVAKNKEAPDALRELSAYLASELRGEEPWKRAKPKALEFEPPAEAP